MENNFIELLKSISSDEELRDIINKRGKPVKIVPGIIYEEYSSEIILNVQYNK